MNENATKEEQEEYVKKTFSPFTIFTTVTTKASKLGEVKVIRDPYKCNRCNYEWSDEHSESVEHKEPTDYTGD